MASSIFKKSGQGGLSTAFPIQSFTRRGEGGIGELASPLWNQDLLNRYWFWEDFLYDALPSDPPFTVYDVSSAGAPTAGLSANATGGAFNIQLAATSEAEIVALTHGDQLQIQGNLPFLFLARVSTVSAMATAQKILIGLGSAADSDPDAMTRNAWFLQAGSTALKMEFDDGTNDVDDQDTGVVVTAGAYAWYAIENGFDGELYFRYATANGPCRTWTFPSKFNAARPSFGANNLQPFIGVYKASGTTQPQIKVDCYGFMGVRAGS
jgi:hypothetical protein